MTVHVSAVRPTLCVIPAFLRSDAELDVLLRCLVSLATTAPDAEVMVVDDCSPERGLVANLKIACDELGFELVQRTTNAGFSTTVNVGLESARASGKDAVLVNADIEFVDAGWLDRMRERTDTDGRPAAVVGARLLYPNGLLQHAGIFLSLLNRDWMHRFHYGPDNLPEALVACRCPVTAALQFIRHETLVDVGLYDEGYRMCFEDVDYCLRVFDAGLECIYEPSVRAYHLEKFFRSKPSPVIERWTRESTHRMKVIWGNKDLSRWVPEVL
jgi:GT2 family glycosyltransferase